ncbi:MAG TPA: hypothetical protein VH143_22435 [Kofleriaceae bacterium]|nr:hypothetical protein [Kofleriaceae bacterium]
MRLVLVALALAACAHPRVIPSPAAPTPAPVATRSPPRWPVAVRVMTWSGIGPVELGELPDRPPATYPALWYVEPVHPIADPATLRGLVVALRRDHVPGLSLRGQPVAAMLGELRDLPELAALIVDDTDIDGPSLAALDLHLTRLYAARTGLDDAAIAAIAARQPQLEVVGFEDCPIGDAGARWLAQLAQLRAVDLDGTAISDDGGAALGALASLRIVDLGHTNVGTRTAAALAKLPLEELFVDGTRMGRALGELAPLAPTLVRFDASSGVDHAPTDRDVSWLASTPNLVEVGLDGAIVHDALVRAIVTKPALRQIRLAGAPITLPTIQLLAAHPDLDEVDLARTVIDDATAATLVASSTLRVLRLDTTNIGDAALAAPALPALRELYLSRTRVGDVGLVLLDAMPELTALGLAEDPAVGAPTIARIAKLSHLRTLVLDHVGGDLHSLAALHELERLYIEQTAADDALVAALPAELRVLHLASTRVTDAALPALRAMHRLEEITLGSTAIDGGLADLAPWPRMHVLSLYGLPLGDSDVAALARAPKLAVLDLSGTDVRELAPLEAMPHLALLGLAETRLAPSGEAIVKRLTARGVDVER